jgi:nitronate monooxygenase
VTDAADALTARLGIRHPILQAPVGGAASPELAAAVSTAGALGGLPLAWTPPNAAADLVRAMRERTGGRPFQVNFALDFAPDALPAALDAGAPAVTFSWGDATPYVSGVRAAGARCGVQVGSVDEARRALDAGADFLVCQGVEAGGHVQATASLWTLLPEVVDAAGDVPVVAAGGVGDGAAIARALSLGAGGAMLGTRFVATRESRAHPLYKRRLVESAAADTALTTCFDGGWPNARHRVLRNATLDAWERAGRPPVGRRPGEGERLAVAGDGSAVLRYDDTTPRADVAGDVLDMPMYAGTSVDAVHDVPGAAELVERLVAECRAAMGGRTI